MRTLTAAAEALTQRMTAAKRFLLQLDFFEPSPLTLRFSDQPELALGYDWLPMVLDWGTLDEALNTTDVGGRPATAQITLLNTKAIEGPATTKTRFSDLIRTPLNTTDTYELSFAKVTIYDLDAALTTGDEQVLGIFYLEEPEDLDNDRLTLSMSDQSLVLEDKLLVTRIDRATFTQASRAVVGRSIPRIYGTLTNVPCVPVIDGSVVALNGALTSGATTVILDDATDFANGDTIQVDVEHITLGTKSTNTFTGCTRAANSTTAVAHTDRAAVYQLRSTYVYVACEHDATFKTKSLSNIRVNGLAALTSPTSSIDDTSLVSGKRFARITFTPPATGTFHTEAIDGKTLAGSGTTDGVTISVTSAGWPTGQDFAVGTVSLTAPTSSELNPATVTRTIVVAYKITDNGDPDAWGAPIIIKVGGRTALQTAVANIPALNVWVTATFTYDTGTNLASEAVVLNSVSSGLTKTVVVAISSYSATMRTTHSASFTSTAGRIIGEVTCDIEGIQDDATGQLTGVASQLLTRPADITKHILTALYPGVSRETDLGRTWLRTFAEQAAAGYQWAFRLEYTEFSKLRRRLGEQGRAVLYLEAGKWEYAYLLTPTSADVIQELDYARDVLEARVRRSPRADVFNSITTYSQRDYRLSGSLEDIYRTVTVTEDLNQGLRRQSGQTQDDRLKLDLELDLVQSSATDTLLGAYWLAWRKRQRFLVDLIAWWNVLAVEKVADYLTLNNHPVLTAHGGTSLIFRVIAKRYLADGKIGLQLIEANE